MGLLGYEGLIQSSRSDTKLTCRKQCQLAMKCFCWALVESACTLMSKCPEGMSPNAGEIMESMPTALKGFARHRTGQATHLTFCIFPGEDPLRMLAVFTDASTNRIGKYCTRM